MLRIHGCISKEHRAYKWLGLRTGTTRRQEEAEPWPLLSLCGSVSSVAPQPACLHVTIPKIQRITGCISVPILDFLESDWCGLGRQFETTSLFPQRNGVCAPSLESGPACDGFDRCSVADMGRCDF